MSIVGTEFQIIFLLNSTDYQDLVYDQLQDEDMITEGKDATSC